MVRSDMTNGCMFHKNIQITISISAAYQMRGSGDLIGGGGGRNPPPHLFEVLLVPGTQKMAPNPKTRQA